jgi:hypothetical protein
MAMQREKHLSDAILDAVLPLNQIIAKRLAL